MYRMMYAIRRFETQVKQLYRTGEIFGAVHLCIGQEAVAVGVCSALRDDDSVFSTHRGHGHLIAKGGDIKAVLAELMGRAAGCSRGCGGSMHLFDPKISFMGSNGIVGAGLTLALGAAFAAQYKGTDAVSVVFFGDGAAQQGTFHEALNLAALWKLPYIAVCENNCYAATTPTRCAVPIQDIAPRAIGYGIPGVVVDGNDCPAVYQAALEAVARARAGQGPTLLECKTYRIEPHCGILADNRPDGEREEWCVDARDAIARMQCAAGLDEASSAAIRSDVERQIAEAVDFARNAPLPDVEEFIREHVGV